MKTIKILTKMNLSILKTKNFSLKSVILFLSFPLLMLSLSSCLNDDDGVKPVDIPVAYVSLYHSSPDGENLSVVVDNRNLFNNAFKYADASPYLRFYTGERELKFTPYNASSTLFDTTVTLKDNEFYSVFVVGTENDIEALVTEDDIPEVSNDKALIRIVHLSPDTEAVNLLKDNDEDPLFDNIEYKKASAYQEIDAGKTSFDLTSSNDDEQLRSVTDYDFKAGNVYTIIVRGFSAPPAGNTNNLSVQIVPNYISY